jgi:hypothetical protein
MSHVKLIVIVGLAGAGLAALHHLMNRGVDLGGIENLGKERAAQLEATALIATPPDDAAKAPSITIDPLAHLGVLPAAGPGRAGVMSAPVPAAPAPPDLTTGRAYILAGVATLYGDPPRTHAKDRPGGGALRVLKPGTRILVIEREGPAESCAFHVSVEETGDFGWIAGTEIADAPPVAVVPPQPVPAAVAAALPDAAADAAAAQSAAPPSPPRRFLTVTLGDGCTLRAESVNYVGESAKVRIEGGIVLTYARAWVTIGDTTVPAPEPRRD